MVSDPFADEVSGELSRIVGPSHVLVDADLRAPYERDWTGRWTGRARLVVRPADTGQVASVVAACARVNAPIVAQGGNTGLVGGGVPRAGEVLLSLSRLDDLEPVDTLAGQVAAGAGVRLASVQQRAEEAGWAFGIDLAARDSATIGGMVATNAGGIHVLRHGSMRAHVRGIEAVLADGSIVRRMRGLVKDNGGYDLPGLLTGSEGTLGVITRVLLGLVPAQPRRATALVALGSVEEALGLLSTVRAATADLVAAELVLRDGLELVLAHTGLADPLPAPAPVYLLIEAAGPTDPAPALAEALSDHPVAAATDRPARQRLWQYRERHTEAISACGVPHKLDVTLPPSRLASFVPALRATVWQVCPGARIFLFGHLAEGNLHVNVIGPASDDDRVDDAVLRLVADHDGGISAEHGIGVAKRRWLSLTRTPDDIAAMRAIKRGLDPAGLMNPGVLL